MDSILSVLVHLPLKDIIMDISENKEIEQAFRQYVSSGYYLFDTVGGLDERYLPDLEKAILPFNPEEGYPPVIYSIIDLYHYGLIDTLPVQVQDMLRRVASNTFGHKNTPTSDVNIIMLTGNYVPSPELSDNKEAMLLLVNMFGARAYKYLSDRLKNDPDIVVTLARHVKSEYNETNYDFIEGFRKTIDRKHLSDKNVALQLLELNELIYHDLPGELQYDKDILLKYFTMYPYIYTYSRLPEHLRDDRDIIVTLMSRSSYIDLVSHNDVDLLAEIVWNKLNQF